MSYVIRDGFTQEDTFPGGHWMEPLKFSYRPCLPERFYEFQAADKTTGKKAMKERSALITECLFSWDVTDDKGIEMKVTDETVRRLPPVIIQYIVDCICRSEGEVGPHYRVPVLVGRHRR